MSLNTDAPASAFVAGEVVTAAKLNEIRTALTGIQAAWDTWTPTFGGFTQGNGTVVARYLRIGKTIKGRISFTAGTTSSFSAGMTWSLPVAIKTDYLSGADTIGAALFVDGGAAGSRTVGGVYVASLGSSLAGMVVDRAGSVANYSTAVNVSNTVPWTWATGDSFACQFEYEAA